jgi:hypothetical protein
LPTPEQSRRDGEAITIDRHGHLPTGEAEATALLDACGLGAERSWS